MLQWTRDVAQAMAHLHSQSPPIAHRDIKPENFLIAIDGAVKLCDFGSCSTHSGTIDTTAVSCRPSYPRVATRNHCASSGGDVFGHGGPVTFCRERD